MLLFLCEINPQELALSSNIFRPMFKGAKMNGFIDRLIYLSFYHIFTLKSLQRMYKIIMQ